MNLYEMEFFMKERQQEIEKEFNHINMSRALRKPGSRFLKEFILEFTKVYLPWDPAKKSKKQLLGSSIDSGKLFL